MITLHIAVLKDTEKVCLTISPEWGNLSKDEAVTLMDSLLSSNLGMEVQWADLTIDGETVVIWMLSRDQYGNTEFTRTEV